MAMPKITGAYGAVYLLDDTSPVVQTNDPMNAVVSLPGDDTVYGTGIYFATGDRTHKVQAKQANPPIIKNGGTVVPTNQYDVHYQKGYVEFYNPVTPVGGTNDRQTLTATGATAGNVTMTWQGRAIIIPWNASAAAAQALFDAAFGAGQAVVGGGALNAAPLTIDGAGGNASSFIALATLSNGLTGAVPTIAHTTPGTSGISISGGYVNTAIAANVGRVAAIRDWQFNMDEADVDGTDYDAGGFGDHLSGIANGTFQFDRMEVEMSLFQKFRQRKRCLFAFYEDIRAPRYWLMTGRMRVFPVSAPVGGIVSGVVQGTISGWPDFLNEPL